MRMWRELQEEGAEPGTWPMVLNKLQHVEKPPFLGPAWCQISSEGLRNIWHLCRFISSPHFYFHKATGKASPPVQSCVVALRVLQRPKR